MKSKFAYALHVTFWIVYMTAFALSEWGYGNPLRNAFTVELLYLPSRLVSVYLNWFFFIPLLLYRGHYVRYLGTLLITICIVSIAQRTFLLYWGFPVFFPEWMDGHLKVFKFTRLLQSMLIITSPVAFTTGWRLFEDWRQKQQREEMLKRQRTESELKYLKAQINPHFLFNTLNNIYGLSLENSKKVPELILKLSDFLSFSLYDSNDKLVSVSKEIKLIEDFIDLQKARFHDRVRVDLVKENMFNDFVVPPLLFIPLVENAFKHSLKDETHVAEISIRFSQQSESLIFRITNTLAHTDGVVPTNTKGGIGLANLRRRLALIYPEHHELTIEDSDSFFSVELKIKKLSE